MEQVVQAHIQEYSEKPDVVVMAPGRFHLIGEHTWYFKDKTLSMAADIPVYIAATVRNDSSLKFYYPQINDKRKANVTTCKFRKEDKWANILKAIIVGFTECGFPCKGLNITLWTDVPPNSGFGITTAIKVATALMIKALFYPNCTENVLLQAIERGNKFFLKVGNYLADIYTCLFAEEKSCLLTDHLKNTHTPIPFDFPDYTILLTDAKVPRISVWSEETVRTAENFLLMAELKRQKNGYWIYEESPTEINDVFSVVTEDIRRRLSCLIKEHKLIMEAVAGLKSSNISQFARAVNKSHEGMRDLYNISCPEIDWLTKRVLELDSSLKEGITGACSRITGKGFGRCTYTILKTCDIDKYIQKLGEYEKIFGFKPSYYEVKPSGGAKIINDF